MDESTALTPRQRDILDAIANGAPDGSPLELVIDLDGPLDPDRLRRAVEEAAATFDALRTALLPVPGFRIPRQVVNAEASVAWTETDAGTAMPLAPAAGRVFRAQLSRQGTENAALTLAVSPLVCDRGGLTRLVAAIADLYAGRTPATGIGLARFTAWREELDASDDAAHGRAYWAGLGPETLTDPRLPSPAAVKPGAATAIRSIPPQTAAGLGSLGQPVDAALQAAWWLLIARITGEEAFRSLWINDPRRDYDMLADGIGAFEDTLPLALRLPKDETVDGLLARVASMMDAHRDAQEQRPDGVLSPSAVTFVLTDALETITTGSLRWTPRSWPAPRPAGALTLEVAMAGGVPVGIALHADPARIASAAVEALADQYLAALAALPGHRTGRVADLPLLAERDLRCHAALTGPALSAAPTIPALLSGLATSRPDAPALQDGTRRWSYRELDELVGRLARHLHRDGVGPGQRVALTLPRSAELVIALHAVMRAGGAYVPVDPDWPKARQAAVIAAAAPCRVLDADDLTALLAQPAPDAALPVATPRDAAYVLFTSGSTGTPKGVVIEHGQLASYVAAAGAALDLEACRRFALTSTVAADLGNTTLFGVLAAGGCLVVADETTMTDGAGFARFVADEAVDCVKIVPSHLAALIDTPAPVLPRTLILGGEPTGRPLLEAIRAAAPRCRVFNHYGPTETTVGVMVHALPPDGPLPDQLPLDRVLAGSRVLLLDPAGRPVPIGAVGELVIGGAQVARGYLGRPEDPAFRADPERDGGRLYRTGDLARLLPEGGLQLVGRADDQIKIRGFRIEPAEIEAAILALPGVAQAAVKVWGEGRLVGYAVPSAGAALDPAALREELRRRLPDAMVPAELQPLDRLPRLGNGKIDRAALPETARSTAGADEAAAPLETFIAGLFAGLLERDRVGLAENLFDLGGHSLLVIKLVSRLRKRLGVEVPPGIVFDHPTPAGLARALRAEETEPGQLDRAAA
ncbi:amino acid adenylation domain-containing protein [Azospirillum oryzae]|uniref:Amino acid adenylation domain-containing protein n=1 Tax=Azospirillum oryzae TaxID=286727 RepID=A0A1X7HLW0_9PROT|nr:amino acid adenylation domain-containing protein [Azospirillum oryzae]SMF89021.1 amino acid adenylation domain-containing protein [Azospirillum oryzae]